jgi:predicted ATPase
MLPPWEEIYVSDAERYESYEQAVLIHDHLMETYKKYGYTIIEVPRDSIENRIDFIMKQLTK